MHFVLRSVHPHPVRPLFGSLLHHLEFGERLVLSQSPLVTSTEFPVQARNPRP